MKCYYVPELQSYDSSCAIRLWLVMVLTIFIMVRESTPGDPDRRVKPLSHSPALFSHFFVGMGIVKSFNGITTLIDTAYRFGTLNGILIGTFCYLYIYIHIYIHIYV